MVTPPVRIGSYRIERLLGVGSFATVWLGYDPSLDAHVAIKVLAENWSHDLRIRERFLDEARLLWRLDDDRIVSVYALGELPDGRPYSVMGWADGGSLRDRLARGPIPVRQAGPLLRAICEGVAVLHDHGIVHRDLAPGNVLFRSRPAGTGQGPHAEHVVIADLGLAKALATASGLTARAGTPGYMAPEQDDPLAVVDRRTDVFGLGQLGVRLLGAPVRRRPGEPVRLREGVPGKVADVLRTATAPRPADRYSDAAALAAALDRATTATRTRPLVRAASRVTMWFAAAALVAGLTSDAVGGRFSRQPGVAVDATGRIAVRLPDGWRATTGRWAWPGQPGGPRYPALLVSPDPARWRTDEAVRGAFIWLARDGTADRTPAAVIAQLPHAGCAPAPVRRSRQAGIDWVIAGFDCADRRGRLVEAAGTAPGGTGLVYVQVAPPAGNASVFVDTLLAGVRVRAG
ncbi:serine/threonine-protein kinase [Actinoplanes sp. NEAU-A12]|uniref:non-specific serine/threonine protein kinase n=1 Tax=Actinoplanes sandaracinus TaxID=3045177 RepID=A0ABT6WWK2_9ACTN|nr:serine/threonine-protein kinase [Actinoplanes sandaracinus]MDI6104132.1 serine/threonine-protein kinase [Actinoplanes sandaracinus]